MAIFKIENNSLAAIEPTSFANEGILERQHLQQMLRENIEIISPNTLIIAEEFSDWEDTKSRVDLLGVDEDGNLVIIELKRNESGSYMDLQAIRYAAMLSTLTFDKAVEIFQKIHQAGSEIHARKELLDFLGWEEPQEDQFARNVRIVLAAAEFSQELTTSVLWLNERNLDISCVRLIPYRNGDQILLNVQQVIPLPDARDYQVKLREQEEKRRETREKRQMDYTKYRFNGQDFGKNRLVLEIVRVYLTQNPEMSFDDLKKKFPDALRNVFGVFDSEHAGKQIYKETGYKRYFIDETDILETGDKKRIAVCNQWSLKTIGGFIDCARNLGFEISYLD